MSDKRTLKERIEDAKKIEKGQEELIKYYKKGAGMFARCDYSTLENIRNYSDNELLRALLLSRTPHQIFQEYIQSKHQYEGFEPKSETSNHCKINARIKQVYSKKYVIKLLYSGVLDGAGRGIRTPVDPLCRRTPKPLSQPGADQFTGIPKF